MEHFCVQCEEHEPIERMDFARSCIFQNTVHDSLTQLKTWLIGERPVVVESFVSAPNDGLGQAIDDDDMTHRSINNCSKSPDAFQQVDLTAI